MSLQVHLQEAKEAHLNWLAQAKDIVENGSIENIAVPVHDAECKFGHYIQDVLKNELDEDSIEAIETFHFLVHDTYSKIFNLFQDAKQLNDDEKRRAQSYFKDLEGVSGELIKLLDSF